MNPFYNFLKNMWVMNRCDKSFLEARVIKNQITQEEYNQIVAMEQITL